MVSELLRPSNGALYKILWAYAYNGSGGARDVYWSYISPDDAGVNLGNVVSCADGTGILLGEITQGRGQLQSPVWADNARYPIAHLTATAGGDDLYVFALVEEFYGAGEIK